MKKKSLSMLLSGLLAVSLTGVGFASWVIVQGDTNEPTGSVSVETVEKKQLKVTATWDEDNDEAGTNDSIFSFGPNGDGDTGWLRNVTMEQERLSLTLNVEVDNFTDYGTGVDITAAADAKADNFAKAVEEKYISNITVGEYTASESFSVVLSIAWGEKFHGENPYTYYNNIVNPTNEQISEAETNIQTLYSYLNGVTFKVTVKSK